MAGPSVMEVLLLGEKQGKLNARQKQILSAGRRFGLVPETFGEKAEVVGEAVLGGATKGAIGLLGLPRDIAAAVINRSSPGVNIGEGTLLKEGAEAIGLPTDFNPDRPLSAVPGRIAEELGAGTAVAGPVVAGARTAKATKGVLGAAAQEPGKFLARETGLSAASGTGAAGAQQIDPSSTGLEITGQLLGAFSPTIATGTARAASGQAQKLKGVINVENRVANALRTAARDPEAALANLRQAGDTVTTPGTAAVTGDIGLRELEAGLKQLDGIPFAEQAAANNVALRNEIERLASADGSPANTAEFLQERITRLNTIVEDRVKLSQDRAEDRLSKLQPGASRTESSRIMREEIDAAEEVARVAERQAWDNTGVKDVSLKKVFAAADEVGQRGGKAARASDIPDVIGDIKTKFNQTEPIGELLDLRSRILADLREAKATIPTNNRLVSNLNKLQVSVLDAMKVLGAKASNKSIAGRVAKALEASSDRFTRFHQGPIGKLEGFDSKGGVRTAPELTGKKLLPRQEEGGEGIKAFKAAVPESNLQAVTNFVLDRFQRDAVPDGALNVKSAKNFLKNNEELLADLPDIKRQINDAILSQERAGSLASRASATLKAVNEKSAASKFIGEAPEKAISKSLAGKKPSQGMFSLIRNAKKDPSGAALKGLKRGFFDEMMFKVQKQGTDVAGEQLVDPNKLREFVKKNKGAIQVLYGIKARKMFDKMVDEAQRIQGPAGLGKAKLEGVELNSIFAQTMGRIVGARLGPKVGASALVLASTGGRLATKALKVVGAEDRGLELLQQAMLDPEAAKTLLMKITPETEQIVVRRLRSHLANLGGTSEEENGS